MNPQEQKARTDSAWLSLRIRLVFDNVNKALRGFNFTSNKQRKRVWKAFLQ